MTNEEYCEKWFEKYRHEVTLGAISDLWNMATKIERDACARLCEDTTVFITEVHGDKAADAIRKRYNKIDTNK